LPSFPGAHLEKVDVAEGWWSCAWSVRASVESVLAFYGLKLGYRFRIINRTDVGKGRRRRIELSLQDSWGELPDGRLTILTSGKRTYVTVLFGERPYEAVQLESTTGSLKVWWPF
jgi:hypothetical protein